MGPPPQDLSTGAKGSESSGWLVALFSGRAAEGGGRSGADEENVDDRSQ